MSGVRHQVAEHAGGGQDDIDDEGHGDGRGSIALRTAG
jgi:hypothetical protein